MHVACVFLHVCSVVIRSTTELVFFLSRPVGPEAVGRVMAWLSDCSDNQIPARLGLVTWQSVRWQTQVPKSADSNSIALAARLKD